MKRSVELSDEQIERAAYVVRREAASQEDEQLADLLEAALPEGYLAQREVEREAWQRQWAMRPRVETTARVDDWAPTTTKVQSLSSG